jgi:hypothetical protein
MFNPEMYVSLMCWYTLDIVLEKKLINSLLLIIKDLTGLCPVVFSFTLKVFHVKILVSY